MRDIFNGDSLQLPVYIAAANEILKKANRDIIPVCGAYYQMKDNENCGKFPVMVDINKVPELIKKGDARLPNKKFEVYGKALTFKEVIERSLNFVVTYVQAILTGNFQHTKNPTDLRCSNYCEFMTICRKDINKLKALY